MNQARTPTRSKGSRPAPPPWPDREVVAEALRLVRDNSALVQAPGIGLVAAALTPEYRQLLPTLGGPYVLRVVCGHRGCRGTLGSWRMDPGKGIAVIHEYPSRPEDRTVPRPYTAAADKGVGYRTGSTTPDGDGTHTSECSKCHHRHDFGVTFRTRLFLAALLDRHTSIYAE